MVLLSNICGLTHPVAGWDALPAPTSLTTEDDIARIKYYRNTVYAHAERASLDDAMFENRPFPSSPPPPFQSEAKCDVFVTKISFHSY